MQIVENRRGRLSRPFLGPGDNFSKSYDENRFVWQVIATYLRIKYHARAPRGAAPTGSVFRHNFSGKYPHDLKMV